MKRNFKIIFWLLPALLVVWSGLTIAGSPHSAFNNSSAGAPIGSSPVWLGNKGGFVFFIAQPASSAASGGAALFKTDGTTAGTTLVAPIDGIGVYTYQIGTLFIAAGTKSYFLANTTSAGQQVWVTDGTATGTHQVADIYQGQNGGVSPTLLGLIGTDLIFAEHTSDYTIQLFRTDGTATGTRALSNFPQSEYGRVTDSVVVNGKVYVALDSALSSPQVDLWVSDGTTSGTFQIGYPGVTYPEHLQPSSLRAFGNSVALLTDSPTYGSEVSVVNTATDTLTILDVLPGSGSGASNGSTIASMDGFLLFLGGNASYGWELWRSDGTLAGTSIVKYLGPGVQFSQLSQDIIVTRVGNRAVFQSENVQNGPQLWSSDGTAQGTVPLIATPTPGVYVQPLLGVVGTHGYYGVYTGTDYRAVVTDGTATGTHVLADVGPLDSNAFSDTQVVGDDNLSFLYAYHYDDVSGDTMHLYAYLPQTRTLTHLLDCVLSDASEPPLAYAGRMYLKASDPLHADQPWVSDGTIGGTQILADLDNNAPITVSPGSLSFPPTPVGSTSSAEAIVLTNIGISTVTFSTISLGGGQADDFELSKTCGATLTVGAHCTLTATFKPISASTKSSSISIADDTSSSPQLIMLSGTGTAVAPAVALSATSLTFANQVVNTRSVAKSITLTNSGTAALTFTSIALTGSQAHDFALTKTCGTTLAAGASCTISVAFTPILTGSKTSTVSITDSVSGSPQVVTLSGTSTVGAPAVTLSTTSLSFANQIVNTSSVPKSITLTNSGTAALTFTSITLTGSQAHDFALTKTCATTLAAGASCSISVAFTPILTGSKTSTVSITDSASGSPQTITLAGTST